MKMRKILIALGILVIFSGGSFAGEYAAEFLDMPVGARAIGMGGAFTAVADDSTGLFWNPAGLAQIQTREFGAMYSDVFAGLVKHNFLNYVHPTNIGTFGLSIVNLGIEDIPDTRNLEYNDINGNDEYDAGEMIFYEEGKIEYKSDTENALFLSYGTNLAQFMEKDLGILVGANLKVIQQSVFEFKSNGVYLDIGALYQTPIAGLNVGLNLKDLVGTGIQWNTGHTDRIPASIKLGVAYNRVLPFTTGATFVFDLDTKYGMNLNAGTEIWFLDLFAIRLGMEQIAGPCEVQNNFIVGAGFKIPGNFRVDYAFVGLTETELGDTHRVSLSARF